MAKFRDSTGRVVMRSTKRNARRAALKVALAWEDSATKARAGELTQAASVKVLRELMEQTRSRRRRFVKPWPVILTPAKQPERRPARWRGIGPSLNVSWRTLVT
jgi:hypothetical protein